MAFARFQSVVMWRRWYQTGSSWNFRLASGTTQHMSFTNWKWNYTVAVEQFLISSESESDFCTFSLRLHTTKVVPSSWNFRLASGTMQPKSYLDQIWKYTSALDLFLIRIWIWWQLFSFSLHLHVTKLVPDRKYWELPTGVWNHPIHKFCRP